jgi:hypothetical protein
MRSVTARYVLANEFRSDLGENGQLKGPAAAKLKNISAPTTADQQKTIHEVAKRLRERHAAAYANIADGIEGELGLSTESIVGSALGCSCVTTSPSSATTSYAASHRESQLWQDANGAGRCCIGNWNPRMLGHQEGWHPKAVDERFAGLPHRRKSGHREKLDSPREPLRPPSHSLRDASRRRYSSTRRIRCHARAARSRQRCRHMAIC